MTQLQYDPDDYQKCRICIARMGEPCRSLSGTVVNGRPDGVLTLLAFPHVSRPRRRGKKR